VEDISAHYRPEPADYESDLPDLSQISISLLLQQDDSVLAQAVRRLVSEVDGGRDAVARFNSSI
jgi:FXSXX-COOH protein